MRQQENSIRCECTDSFDVFDVEFMSLDELLEANKEADYHTDGNLGWRRTPTKPLFSQEIKLRDGMSEADPLNERGRRVDFNDLGRWWLSYIYREGKESDLMLLGLAQRAALRGVDLAGMSARLG